MAITSIANGSAFFIAYQGYGICLQTDETGQLAVIETDNKEDSSVEAQLNKFRQRLMEYIDSSSMELDKIAVVTPLISLMKRMSEKNGNEAPNDMINETIKKAAEVEAMAKTRITNAQEMMEEVLNFMLDHNIPVRQLDGKTIEDKSESSITDLLNRFKKGDAPQ